MIGNKKGLSDIVITLLIVVLSLVAIGGVWFVVKNVLNNGSQQTDITAKCLRTEVQATKVVCDAPIATGNHQCTVSLVKTGTDVISGVKLVFKNVTSGDQSSEAVDSAGDVAEIVGRDTAKVDTKVATTKGLTSVEVVPYFTDTSGNVQLCQQRNPFSFVRAPYVAP